jgi:hypothetical protein
MFSLIVCSSSFGSSRANSSVEEKLYSKNFEPVYPEFYCVICSRFSVGFSAEGTRWILGVFTLVSPGVLLSATCPPAGHQRLSRLWSCGQISRAFLGSSLQLFDPQPQRWRVAVDVLRYGAA